MRLIHKHSSNYSFDFLSRISLFVVFFLVSLFISNHLFGQNSELDKLENKIAKGIGDTAEVNALNRLFWLKRENNPEQAKKHLDKAMVLANKLDYKNGQACAYRYYGSYYYSRSEYDHALKMFNKGKAIFEETGNKDGQISCYNGIAIVAMNQGNYEEALEGYLLTAKLDEEMGNLSGVAKARQNIGNVYYYQGRYDKALNYYRQSLKFKKTIGDSSGMVISLNAIGAVYLAQENYPEALRMQLQTLKIADRVSSLHEKAAILNNIGAQYFYMDKPDSARHYYQLALNIYLELGEKGESAGIYSNLGVLENYLKNSKLALVYFDSSLFLAQEVGDLHAIVESYRGLAESNEMLGNYKAAYDSHVKFHLFNDSLVGESVRQNLDELQIEYEAGKKDQEIIQLQKDQEAKDKENMLYYTVLGISILALALVILSLLFYYRHQKSKSIILQAELEQKALRAQMNPHFIFNSLNSIQRMYIEGKEDIANDYMADFSKLLRSILENSGKTKIKLKEELEITRLYLDLERLRTDGLFEYNIAVDDQLNQFALKIPPLILQPYIENAIWHGIIPKNAKGRINVYIKKKNDSHLICEVTDNGVGFNTSGSESRSSDKNSKGMEITARRLGGERNVQVESSNEFGTKITLTIPFSI